MSLNQKNSGDSKSLRMPIWQRVLLFMMVLSYVITFIPVGDAVKGLMSYTYAAENGIIKGALKVTNDPGSDVIKEDHDIYNRNSIECIDRVEYDSNNTTVNVYAKCGEMIEKSTTGANIKPFYILIEFDGDTQNVRATGGSYTITSDDRNNASKFANVSGDNYIVFKFNADALGGGAFDFPLQRDSERIALKINIIDTTQYRAKLPVMRENSDTPHFWVKANTGNSFTEDYERYINVEMGETITFTIGPDDGPYRIDEPPTFEGRAFTSNGDGTWSFSISSKELFERLKNSDNWKNGIPEIDLTDSFKAKVERFHYAVLNTRDLHNAYVTLKLNGQLITLNGQLISEEIKLFEGDQIEIMVAPHRGYQMYVSAIKAEYSTTSPYDISKFINLTYSGGIFVGTDKVPEEVIINGAEIKIYGAPTKTEHYGNLEVRVNNYLENATVTTDVGAYERVADGDYILVTVTPKPNCEFSNVPSINGVNAIRTADGIYQLLVKATPDNSYENTFTINVDGSNPIKRYTVNYQTNYDGGTVEVHKNNYTLVENGGRVEQGDRLIVEPTPAPNYKVSSISVTSYENGQKLTTDYLDISNRTFTVNGEGDTLEIVVTFVRTDIDIVTVTFPDDVTVTLGDRTLKSGDEVQTYDQLHIKVNVPGVARLKRLLVNNFEYYQSDIFYTVGNADIEIKVEYDYNFGGSVPDLDPDFTIFKITIPDNVVVTRGDTVLRDGSSINKGDVLTVTAVVPNEYMLESLRVNDSPIDNGKTYTVVDDEDVVITVSFKKITSSSDDPSTEDPSAGDSGNGGSGSGDSGSGGSSGDSGNGGSSGNGSSGNGGSGNGSSGNGSSGNGSSGNGSSGNGSSGNGSSSSGGSGSSSGAFPVKPSNKFKANWDVIRQTIRSAAGKTVTINMNDETYIPSEVLKEIKSYNVTLVLKMNDMITWTIEGKNVKSTNYDINLEVLVGPTNIPSARISDFVNGRDYFTLSLAHDGDLGFTAVLSVNVGTKYDNRFADLYWYDDAFKFIETNTVKDGTVDFTFTHASDWIIVINNSSSIGVDSSNGSSSGNTSGNNSGNTPNNSYPNNSSTYPNGYNPSTGSKVSMSVIYSLLSSAAFCMLARKKNK